MEFLQRNLYPTIFLTHYSLFQSLESLFVADFLDPIMFVNYMELSLEGLEVKPGKKDS